MLKVFCGGKANIVAVWVAVVCVNAICTPSAFANEVFKCKTKNGEMVYSDQPCVGVKSGRAALMDAVRQGFLRIANSSDADAWRNAIKKKYELQNRLPPNLPPDLRNAYVVLKRFSYPTGLEADNSAVFYIPNGVPLPTGDYGHSKIYDLNSVTLNCSAASACGKSISRGEIGEGATLTIDFGEGDSVTFRDPKLAPVPPSGSGR